MSHRREGLPPVAVLCPVSTTAEAAAAARAGAAYVDAGDDQALVAAIRQAGIDVLVCGPGEAADLSREPTAAIRTGGILICADAAAADRAEHQGIARDRIVVQVTAGELASAPSGGSTGSAGPAGWRTLVDVDAGLEGKPPGEAAAAAGAVAAVCAWLGASLVRTRQVTEVRRCLDMTESVAGRRPPARAVRGLA